MALYHFAYSFIKIHRTLRMKSAMAAGVTDRLWEVSNLVALLEAEERGVRKSGVRKTEARYCASDTVHLWPTAGINR